MPSRDLLKMALIERHVASGRIGLGLVRSFGLERVATGSLKMDLELPFMNNPG